MSGFSITPVKLAVVTLMRAKSRAALASEKRDMTCLDLVWIGVRKLGRGIGDEINEDLVTGFLLLMIA